MYGKEEIKIINFVIGVISLFVLTGWIAFGLPLAINVIVRKFNSIYKRIDKSNKCND